MVEDHHLPLAGIEEAQCRDQGDVLRAYLDSGLGSGPMA